MPFPLQTMPVGLTAPGPKLWRLRTGGSKSLALPIRPEIRETLLDLDCGDAKFFSPESKSYTSGYIRYPAPCRTPTQQANYDAPCRNRTCNPVIRVCWHF